MTSATGSPRVRRRGFTLVELLTVVAILGFLATIVIAMAGTAQNRAAVEKTKSTLLQLSLKLAEFKEQVGAFPSDGYDSQVLSPNGTELYSSAALAHAMTNKLQILKRLPTGKFKKSSAPALMERFGKDFDESPDDDTAFEFIDGWGMGFHYDNVSAGEKGESSFSEQSDGSAHLLPPDVHNDDPRLDTDVVVRDGPQNKSEYDLWSHGPNGHSDDELGSEAVANFKIIGVEEEE